MEVGPDVDSPFHPLVPEQYRHHELVAGSVFYTLPVRLLTELVGKCGRGSFDEDLLQMEVALSEKIAHHPGLVGYSEKGEAITYSLLSSQHKLLWDASDAELDKMSATREKWETTRQQYTDRAAPFLDALRGYCGWLLTNREFLGERDELFATWEDRLARDGIPLSGPTMFGGVPHEELVRKVLDGEEVRFLQQFETFYARWRLQHLLTAELPEPLAPQIPLLTPVALLTHMKAGGVTLYQPDTMPIPSANLVRQMLDDVRMSHDNEHLAEWVRIVRKGRQNDHAVRAFGKIFVLHHYWMQLEQRHPLLFKGRVRQVHEAFAEFLYVSPDAVDKYRQKIRSRLPAP